jgi:hypothetical protein
VISIVFEVSAAVLSVLLPINNIIVNIKNKNGLGQMRVLGKILGLRMMVSKGLLRLTSRRGEFEWALRSPGEGSKYFRCVP